MKRKQVQIMILIAFAIPMFSACGSQKDVENSEEKLYVEQSTNDDTQILEDSNGVESEMELESEMEGGKIIFETEYKIEDYCDGVFIVSKSNGLLYGVLNQNGEEILPVDYDNIYFLNDENVIDHTNENVYIQAVREGVYAVYDKNGNKLLDKSVGAISYELGEPTSASPLFMSSTEASIQDRERQVFNENGDLVTSIIFPEGTSWVDVYWISPDLYLNCSTEGISLCETTGDVLQTWYASLTQTAGVWDGKYYMALYMTDGTYNFVEISADKTVETQEGLTQDDVVQLYVKRHNTDQKEYYIGENGDCKIYSTNNTWKYENADGMPIYDERYFSLTIKEGAYLLSNSENQVCVVSSNGKKTVDYGYIELQNENYSFQGMVLADENIFADYNSVCFVENVNDLSRIWFFN